MPVLAVGHLALPRISNPSFSFHVELFLVIHEIWTTDTFSFNIYVLFVFSMTLEKGISSNNFS